MQVMDTYNFGRTKISTDSIEIYGQLLAVLHIFFNIYLPFRTCTMMAVPNFFLHILKAINIFTIPSAIFSEKKKLVK